MNNLDNLISIIDESKSKFLEHCIDMLRLIDPNGHSSFESNRWVIPFSNKSRNKELFATLNFDEFNRETLKFKPSIRIEFEVGEFINLTIIDFAKWLFLKQRHDNSLDYRSVWYLEMLKMLFAYLRENNIDSLNESGLEDFFSLSLTNDFVDGDFVRRLSSPAYGSRFKMFNLSNITRTLRLHSVDEVVHSIHDEDLNKAFNAACLAQIGMTLADYKKGGTFDFLTLDVGKHYIDYCANYFEQHIVFATALRNSLNQLGMDTDTEGNKDEWNSLFSDGYDELKEQFYNILVKNYNKIVIQYHAFNLDKLSGIITALNLDETRFDSYEFVRSLLYARFYNNQLKKRENILAEYSASLNSDNAGFKIEFTLQEFDEVCDSALGDVVINLKTSKLIMAEHAAQFDTNTRRNIASFFRDVIAAGITSLVAYTGWRASEYGFPESALKSEVNKDILDAVYSPFRFYIKWISPKTNGETLLDREITLSSSVLIKQISALAASKDNNLALSSAKFGKNTEIERQIYNMVTRHWKKFPDEYATFLDLDELQLLNSKDSNLIDLKRKEQLSEKYDLDNRKVKELLDLRDKLRKGNKTLALVSRKYVEKEGSIDFAKIVNRFVNGSLDEDSVEIFESRLSSETLDYIKYNQNDFSSSDLNAIRAEICAGVYKATPHALRHIWAEAVLRRYRGDVGKFIRANFKHIDERFFMAYLRGKEARAIMQVAKRTTINHIVSSRIKSLSDERRHYSGQFDKFINKAVVITKAHTPEEFEKLTSNIANNRIIDIKVNAWNTCVLRKNTFFKAKCSQNGVPQRHNAAPKFCLGCINGDITEANYKGIVVYTKPDIEACRNPNLPMFIKKQHLVIVRLALQKVQELNKSFDDSPYQAFIDYLNETIDLVCKFDEAS
ncbi:hypothetical protein L0668_19870 [Paraglaciecola aquimarina]|uniref:Uncharacterized protein n=1 Tax=Paraglaciecola algarum TaxID=3050085 RepID=A0ABS9DEA6_9ALTE|nr:hypothetical protein [Paraglaciecola sp. G1-23]MCF2950377.1 hypothetical protein [Paraglaciecola sp. G1-23]